MTKQDILTYSAMTAGVVAIFQLLEFIFGKNLPWFARLFRRSFRWAKRRIRLLKGPTGQRHLLINFSSHIIQAGQKKDIQKKMQWPALEVIDARLGNVPENRNFVKFLVSHIEKIDLTTNEWQTARLAVAPAGYVPAWSVLLSELHGRLGYFPDVVRLRPAPKTAEEKFEVAEIVALREIRSQARVKR